MRTLKEKREAQHRNSINIFLSDSLTSPLKSESFKVHPVTAKERISGLIRLKKDTRHMISRSEAVIEQENDDEPDYEYERAITTRNND